MSKHWPDLSVSGVLNSSISSTDYVLRCRIHKKLFLMCIFDRFLYVVYIEKSKSYRWSFWFKSCATHLCPLILMIFFWEILYFSNRKQAELHQKFPGKLIGQSWTLVPSVSSKFNDHNIFSHSIITNLFELFIASDTMYQNLTS